MRPYRQNFHFLDEINKQTKRRNIPERLEVFLCNRKLNTLISSFRYPPENPNQMHRQLDLIHPGKIQKENIPQRKQVRKNNKHTHGLSKYPWLKVRWQSNWIMLPSILSRSQACQPIDPGKSEGQNAHSGIGQSSFFG